MYGHNRLRGRMEIAGPGIIAKSRPGAHHIGIIRRRKARKIGPERRELLEIGSHRRNLSLLQRELHMSETLASRGLLDSTVVVFAGEFGRTPFFTASEFQEMGYRMVIWPVSAFRVANKAQERLYAAIRRDGGTQNMIGEMQTRAELYKTIGYHDYEALDASIVETVVPDTACTSKRPPGASTAR